MTSAGSTSLPAPCWHGSRSSRAASSRRRRHPRRRAEARELAEDRVGLLAETMLRGLDPTWEPTEVVREALPWAVRLPSLAQDGRDLLAAGRPGRPPVSRPTWWRSPTRRGWAATGSTHGSCSTGAGGAGRPRPGHDDLPHRARPLQHDAPPPPAADALDGLAGVARARDLPEARSLAAGTRAPHTADGGALGLLRRLRHHPRHRAGRVAGRGRPVRRGRAPGHGHLQPAGERTPLGARRADGGRAPGRGTGRRPHQTKIAEELFVSPRTVDAHLTHIYRKLDINTRARLAALVMEQSQRAL